MNADPRDTPRSHLGVRKVQSSIHFVQNVQWSGLEQQQRQDERQGHQRPLSSAELSQALLPSIAKGHL